MNGKKVIINFFWRFFERGLSQVISFVVSLVLARLIDPSAYGSLALATIFTTILMVFVDCGLNTALVQKKEVDNLDYSSVFYFNLAMCAVIYVVIYLAAPMVSSFYEDATLAPLVRTAGLIVPASGFRSVQQAYVERSGQFQKLFCSTLIATIVSGAVGLIMAYWGYGVWALITMNVTNVVVGSMVLWCTVKWRPMLRFSLRRMKPLVRYGAKVLGSSLVISVYSNSRQLLVGKFYSSSDLAFYNKGNSMPNMIVPTIQTSITSVLLPVISQHQDNRAAVKEMTGKTISMMCLVLWPLMVGLAACAENFIPLAMTEKWNSAVPYMQLFCVEAAIWPMSSIYVNSIRAIGRSDLDFKFQTIVRLFGILLLLLMIRHGPFAVALCAFLCSVFEIVIMIVVIKNVLEYSIRQQLRSSLPYMAMSLAMGMVVYLIGKVGISWGILVLQILCGIVIYAVLIILFERKIISEIVLILRKKAN